MPLGTAAVAEVSVVEEASMAVGVVSMGEVSVVVSTAVALVLVVFTVVFVVALWPPDTLEAESEAAAVESALVDRAFQVAFLTLPVPDPGSPHLGDLHSGNLPMKRDPIDP